MRPMQGYPELAPWRELRETLAGSFAARSRGLLASEFALMDRDGEEVGRLRLRGTAGAELEAGDLGAKIESAGRSRHVMLTGGTEVLTAENRGSPDALDVTCAGRPYSVRINLLRNTASALSPENEESARVTGGLTNRRYEAVFDARDEGSLPVAVFLLHRTVELRRGAYRAST